MTPAEITLAAFTLCNSLRVVAYVPQIAKAATDRSGVEAVSLLTWGLFLLANLSAIAYALVNKADWTMALVFIGNAVGCVAILLVGLWKRSRCRNRRRQHAGRRGGFARRLPRHRSGACAVSSKIQKNIVTASDEPAGVERSAGAVAPIVGWQRHVRPF